RAKYAAKASAATISAVHAASVACRAGSPPEISASDAPIRSEIADVTVTAVCFELQNNQNARPPNRHAYNPACGGRPASEASPIADGRRYAASVTPAATSARSHVRSYAVTHARAGMRILPPRSPYPWDSAAAT